MSTKPDHEQMDRDFVDASINRLKAKAGDAWSDELEASLRNEFTENFKSQARAQAEMNAFVGQVKSEFKSEIEEVKKLIPKNPSPSHDPAPDAKPTKKDPPQSAVDIAGIVSEIFDQKMKPFNDRFDTLETTFSKEKQSQSLNNMVRSHFGEFGNNAEGAYRQALAAAGGEVVYRDGKDPAIVPMGQADTAPYLKVGDQIIQNLPDLVNWWKQHPSGQALLPAKTPGGGSGSHPTQSVTNPSGGGSKEVPAEETMKQLMRGKGVGSPSPLMALLEDEK